ncbi:MAG: hypothetical protein HY360_23375 [Verrucomicrobia bacterium]|nr:hypothetical protein [Verrucomicrobiota bacterium]
MQTKIKKIGAGFGLLLPKKLLDACGFGSEATVTLLNKTLIVIPGSRQAREGWAETLRSLPQGDLKREPVNLRVSCKTPL